jgi:hypothetical protein
VANCKAYLLSGIIYTFFFVGYHFSWITLESWFKILSLFSVSGSSSVNIVISEYFTAISHIIGRFSLSRFHGAPHIVINLPSHFLDDAKLKVFSNPSGVCAKSTKYLASFVYTGSILPDTHWNDSIDFKIGSIFNHRVTPTEIAHIILQILYDQIN